jgi:hypothetical protein
LRDMPSYDMLSKFIQLHLNLYNRYFQERKKKKTEVTG